MEFEQIMSRMRELDSTIDYLDGEVQAAIDIEDGSHFPIIEELDEALAERADLLLMLKYQEAEVKEAEVSKWTPDSISDLLDTMHKDTLHKPLMRMWERQTEDERACGGTRWSNGIGFNAHDAGFAARMVDWWNDKGFFTPKQGNALRKMLKKYRKQLADIANTVEAEKKEEN